MFPISVVIMTRLLLPDQILKNIFTIPKSVHTYFFLLVEITCTDELFTK